MSWLVSNPEEDGLPPLRRMADIAATMLQSTLEDEMDQEVVTMAAKLTLEMEGRWRGTLRMEFTLDELEQPE